MEIEFDGIEWEFLTQPALRIWSTLCYLFQLWYRDGGCLFNYIQFYSIHFIIHIEYYNKTHLLYNNILCMIIIE